VTTPLADTSGAHVGASVGLVPILRRDWNGGRHPGVFAGSACVPPRLVPRREDAGAGRVLQPVFRHKPVDIAFVLDPMLATGGSACVAVARLKSGA